MVPRHGQRRNLKKVDVAEMSMLRWMCGVTKLDRIQNERIRGSQKCEKY